MTFETPDRSAVDRDLDETLRLALADEDLDVSPILSRVRREMRPLTASRRHVARKFVWGGIAAAFLSMAIVSATLIDVARRSHATAIDAACDHDEELVRPSAKKWQTQPADVSVYLSQRFPDGGNLVGALTPPGASFEKVGTCRLDGVRFAHFVYRLGAREISVFVRLTGPLELPTPRFDYYDDRFGLQVAAFNTRRYTGVVVSTLASAATRGMSDTIARRLSLVPES